MNQPSVKKNYSFRLFYEILNLITPFITAPYVSRVLGADGVGIYSYTSSIVAYFTMFAALGTVEYGTREIAQHREDKYVSSKLFYEIELLTVITSSVCIVAWVVVILASDEYRFYFLALLPLLFGTMFDISWYFTGFERIGRIVLRNTMCKLAGIVLLFIFVRDKDDLIIYIVLNSAITLIGNLSMWTYLPKMLAKVDLKTLSLKGHFRETLIYFVPTIAISIYTVLDKTLIGLITQDSYANGYYEQADKIIRIAKTIVFVAVNSVVGARMSYLFSQGKMEEIRSRLSRSMDFILLLGFGAMFGIWAIARNFVPVFFGTGYEPVIILLCLMAPLVVIIGISNCLDKQYYTPAGLKVQITKYIIIGAIVNVGINLCLIPFFGAVGAVIASLVAETVITVLTLLKCNGYLTLKQIGSFSWKRIIAGIIMFVVVILFGMIFSDYNSILILILQIIIGITLYGVILLIWRDEMMHYLFNMGMGVVKKTMQHRKK